MKLRLSPLRSQVPLEELLDDMSALQLEEPAE